MTPPLLNAPPARIHRRSIPSTAGSAQAAQAERHREALARNEPVVVRVDGYGRGWYVEAVGDGLHLWRDGQTLIAAWTDVPLGQ
ncbi:hypothetical protein [Micromonospora carbonacea]|uniref:Uncharacterized protein n=1 Tax=Micromonospora carbonacea TaxID=47853 RepID=A0A1C5AAQ3_9ACTN|nr:hypothetical protein [Micromonospora carbonacea]SCF42239.1 hypothetical protein GA0070563_11255 [Micromonospora carbonacea]